MRKFLFLESTLRTIHGCGYDSALASLSKSLLLAVETLQT